MKDVSFMPKQATDKQISRPQNERARISAQISNSMAKVVAPENQIRGLSSMPRDSEEQNKLGVELVEWAASNYFVDKFPITKRINPYRFFKTKEINPFFAECVQLANCICALNIKEASLTGEIPTNLALAYLPLQDGDYRGFTIERIAKKVIDHIKENEVSECSWIEKLIALERERNGQTNQPIRTETLPD